MAEPRQNEDIPHFRTTDDLLSYLNEDCNAQELEQLPQPPRCKRSGKSNTELPDALAHLANLLSREDEKVTVVPVGLLPNLQLVVLIQDPKRKPLQLQKITTKAVESTVASHCLPHSETSTHDYITYILTHLHTLWRATISHEARITLGKLHRDLPLMHPSSHTLDLQTHAFSASQTLSAFTSGCNIWDILLTPRELYPSSLSCRADGLAYFAGKNRKNTHAIIAQLDFMEGVGVPNSEMEIYMAFESRKGFFALLKTLQFVLEAAYVAVKGIVDAKKALAKSRNVKGALEVRIRVREKDFEEAVKKAVARMRHFQKFMYLFRRQLPGLLKWLEKTFEMEECEEGGCVLEAGVGKLGIETYFAEGDGGCGEELHRVAGKSGWAAAALRFLELCNGQQNSVAEMENLFKRKRLWNFFDTISVSTIDVPAVIEDDIIVPLGKLLSDSSLDVRE